MRKSVIILSVSVMVLLPGLGKFVEPFKTLVHEQLTLCGIPFPDQMMYLVKFSQMGVGLLLIFLVLYGNKLKPQW